MWLAGGATLLGLCLAMLYQLYSTPYTMSVFFIGGPSFILIALGIFVRAQLRYAREQKAILTPLHFEAGETIFRQGDPADCVYYITQGELEASYKNPEQDHVTIRRVGAHEYFGISAALNEGTRKATGVAVTPVEMLRIKPSDFHLLHTQLPKLREDLQSQIEHRRSELEKK